MPEISILDLKIQATLSLLGQSAGSFFLDRCSPLISTPPPVSQPYFSKKHPPSFFPVFSAVRPKLPSRGGGHGEAPWRGQCLGAGGQREQPHAVVGVGRGGGGCFLVFGGGLPLIRVQLFFICLYAWRGSMGFGVCCSISCFQKKSFLQNLHKRKQVMCQKGMASRLVTSKVISMQVLWYYS